MIKEIIWSPLSKEDFDNLLNYLKTNWQQKVVLEYFSEIQRSIILISQNPKQFPLLNKRKKIRKCVISVHNSILYRETKTNIELLRFFDTRQNPSKIKK